MRSVVVGLGALLAVAACSGESGSEGNGGGGLPGPGLGLTTSSSSSSTGGGGGSSSGGASSSSFTWEGFPTCEAAASSSSSSSSTSSGGGSGSSSGDPWGCLGSVCFPAPTLGSITITVQAKDHIADSVVPDVTVALCAEGDLECATPLQTEITDALGQVELNLPLTSGHGFYGHLQLTGDGRVPTIVHLYPPPAGTTSNWLVGVFTPAQLELVAQLAGADNIKPYRGHVGALVENCLGEGSAGVTFELEGIDIVTSWAYLVNNIPDASATETDETGAVGFFNVPDGFTFLSARRVADNALIGRVPVLVRPDWVTTLVVPPTPQ